jgi:hypothetical protein
MFEPLDVFHVFPGLVCPLGRLNKTLFLMLIDSASRAVSSPLGKPGFCATSNFIRPNQ